MLSFFIPSDDADYKLTFCTARSILKLSKLNDCLKNIVLSTV